MSATKVFERPYPLFLLSLINAMAPNRDPKKQNRCPSKKIVSSDSKAKAKPLSAKKKDPQSTLHQFFSKATSRRPQMNFQGYPIKQCVYEPSIKKWVFHPPGWGEDLPAPYTSAEWFFCDDCKLKPCLAIEKSHEIFGGNMRPLQHRDAPLGPQGLPHSNAGA